MLLQFLKLYITLFTNIHTQNKKYVISSIAEGENFFGLRLKISNKIIISDKIIGLTEYLNSDRVFSDKIYWYIFLTEYDFWQNSLTEYFLTQYWPKILPPRASFLDFSRNWFFWKKKKLSEILTWIRYKISEISSLSEVVDNHPCPGLQKMNFFLFYFPFKMGYSLYQLPKIMK